MVYNASDQVTVVIMCIYCVVILVKLYAIAKAFQDLTFIVISISYKQKKIALYECPKKCAQINFHA